ncbi:MAG: MotA/TolQ/ExbB proton channel family protein [Sulfurospirillum sp.]|nr:MAG: MotA/TolQ/ExbB proton channel family protein [Sulfurospirillum sp.]
MELLFTYITSGGIISTLVFIWLSIYFILTVWVWLSRYLTLNKWESIEKKSLEILLHGSRNISRDSILSRCLASGSTYNTLAICKSVAEKKATTSLSILSVISSTAPFIGLFGTIVSILNTFSQLGNAQTASLTVIAPAISEALVATAAGIFVAIPAYSAHVLLKRKAYELMNMIQREIELLSSDDNFYNG